MKPLKERSEFLLGEGSNFLREILRKDSLDKSLNHQNKEESLCFLQEIPSILLDDYVYFMKNNEGN